MTPNATVAVSVVIPCYRCANTLQRAVDSVLHQTRMPTELILVDDASDDQTLNVLRDIEQSNADFVKIIALDENHGPANARNAGWALATQPYIAFLDADDAWHPEKLAIQYAYMTAYPDIMLSGHERRILMPGDGLPNWQLEPEPREHRIRMWPMLLSNRFITPSVVMVRRDIEQRFSPTQRYSEDYLLWLQIVSSGRPVVKLNSALATTYKQPFGDAGLSAHLWQMQKNELKNYRRLYRAGCINVLQWCFPSLYSSLKFMRRVLIVTWRKMAQCTQSTGYESAK